MTQQQKSKQKQRKLGRANWIEVGRVLVNPENVLAVKIARAAQAAEKVFATARPSDEVAAVEAAVAKRARKAAR